jgi:hypothetical protein
VSEELPVLRLSGAHVGRLVGAFGVATEGLTSDSLFQALMRAPTRAATGVRNTEDDLYRAYCAATGIEADGAVTLADPAIPDAFADDFSEYDPPEPEAEPDEWSEADEGAYEAFYVGAFGER